MKKRKTTNKNKMFSVCIRQMERFISMAKSEKPIERIRAMKNQVQIIGPMACINDETV